ncbi:MAG: hypothetical protein ACO3FE_10410 [Planctomycetaceae bacterium]
MIFFAEQVGDPGGGRFASHWWSAEVALTSAEHREEHREEHRGPGYRVTTNELTPKMKP